MSLDRWCLPPPSAVAVTMAVVGSVGIAACGGEATAPPSPSQPPQNMPPVAVGAIPNAELAEGDSTAVDLLGYFRDPDGDRLIYAGNTSNASVARASVAGSTVSVLAISPGTATVTATATDAGGLTAYQEFQILVSPQSSVSISVVNPSPLVEGQAAIIGGSGFSNTMQDNQVSFGGRLARITAASDTSLSVIVPESDCLPPRSEELRVTVLLRSTTRSVVVSPLSRDDLQLPRYFYRYTRAGNGCLHLPRDVTGGEYLLGISSIAESPADLTSVTLTSRVGVGFVLPEADPTTGGAEPSPPDRRWRFGRLGAATHSQVLEGDQPVPTVSPRPRYDGLPHYETLTTNRALLRRLARASAPPSLGRLPAQTVTAGDTLLLYSDPTRTCSSGERAQTVVRFVGDHTVWLEDLSNGGGSLVDSNFQSLDNFYASRLRSIYDTYYGALSDVDGNERFFVLITQDVNRAGISSAVWPGDLHGEEFCPSSNNAEVVYVEAPDPDGTVGQRVTADEVWGSLPRVLAHEVTHLVQYTAFVHGAAGEKTSWELEGGAELAEQLVGFGMFRHESGQNLGYDAFVAGREWYADWLRDLLRFFGWDPSATSSTPVDGAPAECGWLGGVENEAVGPCVGGAMYGVASLLLRYSMDRWGAEYPGGEQGLLRRFTQSPYSGFRSLEDVSNWRIEQLLADFYIGLWMDGRTLSNGEILDSFGFTTWDIHGIIGNLLTLPFRPRIDVSSTANFSRSWNVRAGSTAYVHWTPGGRRAATSLKVTSSSGGPIPDPVSVWALRIR